MSKKIAIILLLVLFIVQPTFTYGKSADTGTLPTIKIGGNFELTGGIESFGKSAATGAELAFRQINRSGGLLGRQIEFIVADNMSKPFMAAQISSKLIRDHKVVAILGCVASSNTLAGLSEALYSGIPVISPTATNPKITIENGQLKPYAFRACFIDSFQGALMANFALKSLKAKTAAIYIDNSSDYSRSIAETFEKAFVANGGAIIAKESYLQKERNFIVALSRINSMKPEVIFIPGFYEEVGLIINQARELGITVPLLGVDGWDSPRIVQFAGPAALNNSYFINHYLPEDPNPKNQQFVEDYTEEYGHMPDALAALGYDTALMLAKAIKQAGSTDPETIKNSLEKVAFEGVTGATTIDTFHNPIKPGIVIKFVNGKQTFFQRVESK